MTEPVMPPTAHAKIGCYLCEPPVPNDGTDDWHEACSDCDKRLFWPMAIALTEALDEN